MSEPPRRPILKLKSPPPSMLAPKPVAAPTPTPTPAPTAAPAITGPHWKCKPCGAPLVLTGDEPADEAIRCPNCNARLGTAQDFRDGASRVRARRIEG